MTDMSFPELLQHMRSRPGMYIGGLNARGIGMLADGIIDDLLDASGSKFHNARLTLGAGRSLALEVVCEVGVPRDLSICAEFNSSSEAGDAGQSNPCPFLDFVIAAGFSSSMELEVVQPDYSWRQRVEPACIVHPPERIAFTGAPRVSVRLQPDASLFPPEAEPSFYALCAKMQEHAVTHAGAKFTLIDATSAMLRDYHYPRGLRDYVSEIAPPWDVLSPVFHLSHSKAGDSAEAAILDKGVAPGIVHTFVNGRRCFGSGSDVKGLASGITSVLSQKSELVPWFDPEQPLDGKTIALSLRLREPQWEGSTKTVLIGEHVESLVREMVVKHLAAEIERRNEKKG